jgi:hypothetical protein
MNLGGFSWKRLLGISAAKSGISWTICQNRPESTTRGRPFTLQSLRDKDAGEEPLYRNLGESNLLDILA